MHAMTNNALLACLALLGITSHAVAAGTPFTPPPIYPIPQEAEYQDGSFKLAADTVVLLPARATEHDRFLAGLIRAEMAEAYDLTLPVEEASDLSGKKNFLLIGSASNPLVRDYATQQKVPVSAANPGHEGYYLRVDSRAAVVLGSDEQGAFYGLQSLRQLIRTRNGSSIPFAMVRDWPHMPFRGIHIYMPGPDDIGFYGRFVRDCLAYMKFNKIIMEVGAGMRLERHPELNAGWGEFTRDLFYTQRDRPRGPGGEDASHTEVAAGRVLDKGQVANLVEYARQFHIEVIPEVQSLTHCYYLLSRHRELAEVRDAEWPDAYCPLHPGSYELYFDVLGEYIDVMRPRMVHIGHDEWRIPVDVCARCKGKDYSELFAQDVTKIHGYLMSRNIRVAMWGDHLDRSPGLQKWASKGSKDSYMIPGSLTPEQVQKHIPKDILVFNWSWTFKNKVDTVRRYADWGFEQVLGNFGTHLDYPDNQERNWEHRSRLKGVLGGAPSPWWRVNEFYMGSRLYEIMGTANHLWSTIYPDVEGYNRIIQNRMPETRMHFRGVKPPSRDRNPIQSLDISASFDTSQEDRPQDIDFGLLKRGTLKSGAMVFELHSVKDSGNLCAAVVRSASDSGTKATRSRRIPIDRDASSLIFLHACAHAAARRDVLGWYRIIYEDGFEQSIPIEYQVNIREWNLFGIDPRTGKRAPFLTELPWTGEGALCYDGDMINCSAQPGRELNFFAYEWRNPRYGIKIKEIYLEGSKGSVVAAKEEFFTPKELSDNAVALIALSCVTKRDITASKAR